jgi:hypothetical protein
VSNRENPTELDDRKCWKPRDSGKKSSPTKNEKELKKEKEAKQKENSAGESFSRANVLFLLWCILEIIG